MKKEETSSDLANRYYDQKHKNNEDTFKYNGQTKLDQIGNKHPEMSNFDAMLMQEFKSNKYLLSQKAAEDIDE